MINHKLTNNFRAYKEYTEALAADPRHARLRASVSRTVSSCGSLDVVRKSCEINPDWIEAIEDGLDYIKKAIDEQRQFIRQDGNVVPIEKARRVSKESAVHLAKHNELLSHTEGEAVRPEKLFMKENQSNYLVYENRFLYMAICYIRDFVDTRYKRIIETDNAYDASLLLDAKNTAVGRELRFKLDFSEKRTEDEYFGEKNSNHELIERIQAIRFAISAFLGSELMTEVSAAPMLKPPITPTNVIRMDTSFREVHLLYTRIAAYEGDGFTVCEKKLRLSPLTGRLADDIAELILTNSFIVYCHGNELQDYLNYALAEEALALKLKELEKFKKYAEALRARFGVDGEEYRVALERKFYELEASLDALSVISEKNTRLVGELEASKARTDELSRQYERRSAELSELRLESELKQKQLAHEHAREIEQISARHGDEINAHTEAEEALKHQLSLLQAELKDISLKLDASTEENSVLRARLRAASPSSLPDIDPKSEDDFNALELEKRAYDRYFDKLWREARSEIRKKHLWHKK